MNRILNKRQAICGSIWILVVCAALALWPFRLIHEEVQSVSGREKMEVSEAVNADHVVQQRFIAQYDRLKNIEIYLADVTRGDKFNFVLRDASMQTIMQQVINIGDMETIPGYCRIQVNIDTEVGRDYYFLLQGVESELYVAYTDNTGENANIYISASAYDGVEDAQRCVVADYEYEVPLRKGKTLAFYAVFLLFGVFATWFGAAYYEKHPERNTLVTVERAMRFVLNPLIVAAGAACAVAIGPCHILTTDIYSILFYELGVILAVAVGLYAVNHDRTGIASDRTVFRVLQGRWQDDLQSVMIAGAIWGCCNYMNALYEIHHTVAYRQVLIFFALALIVTYQKKELFNWINLIYAVIAAAAGPVYYKNALAALMDKAVLAGKETPDELEILALKLTVWAGILAGIVILNTLVNLFKRKVHGISVPYGILVGVFFALLILYRNTRGWPIFLVCVFTLCYLRMASGVKKAVLIHNIVNGILLHFVATVGYCLLHRPYMYFRYYRYPFHFHTVTISAVYLALVVCAALIKFMDAYGRRPSLAGTYKELAVFGLSSMYLLITLSRTGYLAVLVTAAVVIPMAFFSGKTLPLREKWQHFLRGVGMMALAVIVGFPIVFTAQRAVPAAAADIRAHEIEDFPTELVHGRDMDSYYYITVERFIQTFQMKVLGIPEEKCLNAFLYFSRGDGESEYRSPYLENGGKRLLASAEDMAAAEAAEEESYTNGRLYIFERYYERLNRNGHDDMGVMEPDGNYLAHAHNIYLQVAYDHGIFVGGVFLLLGIGTFVQACFYYRRHREDRECALFPLALLVLFAVAGLTEWIFHPCCPIACCLLLTMGPLLVDTRKDEA
ncbi:MAG: hypothetical protein K2O15_01880 [Lachnospiraceae bacterium]|nr:hypothetical protein [Lachnospiraceae bacterium]